MRTPPPPQPPPGDRELGASSPQDRVQLPHWCMLSHKGRPAVSLFGGRHRLGRRQLMVNRQPLRRLALRWGPSAPEARQ